MKLTKPNEKGLLQVSYDVTRGVYRRCRIQHVIPASLEKWLAESHEYVPVHANNDDKMVMPAGKTGKIRVKLVSQPSYSQSLRNLQQRSVDLEGKKFEQFEYANQKLIQLVNGLQKTVQNRCKMYLSTN